MLSTRVIPVLLLKGAGLVKTKQFDKPVYVGDPINAVRIFNDKEVDELIFLDIEASKKGLPPNMQMIENIANECFMPVCYGGGITSTNQIREILNLGIEKVSLNRTAFENPEIVTEAAKLVGSQSIIVSIDIKKKYLGDRKVFLHHMNKLTKINPLDYAKKMEDAGAGELLINDVDRDGMMTGYDIDNLNNISSNVDIPVIALGGAGGLHHFKEIKEKTDISAVAAGSMFVFHGKYHAILISYPVQEELTKYLK